MLKLDNNRIQSLEQQQRFILKYSPSRVVVLEIFYRTGNKICARICHTVKLDDCIVWNATIQYSARSGSLCVHKLFTFCIRRCLVSRACDLIMSALSAVLLFSVSYSGLLFFHGGPLGRTAAYWFTQYRTSDVAENLGR